MYNKVPKEQEIVAIHQIIDATWMIRCIIPDDEINKTKEICGESPDIILLEHKRDDSFYCKAKYLYRLIEGDKRIAKKVDLMSDKHEPLGIYDVRNKKYVFDYLGGR